jgi:hypothetical protein
MSATTTTGVAVTATPASSCGSTLYEIPTSDAACAMPYGGNHTDVMAKCCKQVVSYLDDCGLYCLAQGQSVEDLTDCLYENGAAYQDVFCNALTNATATAKGDVKPTASGATVVASNGAKTSGSSDDNDDGDSGSDSDGGSGGDDDSAAVSVRGLSAAGVSLVMLLLSSTVFGALLG